MRITVFTIFPELIQAACRPSILGAAIENGLLDVATVDPRTYAEDRHRTVDDVPFGGGAGMVFRAEPLSKALDAAAAAEPEGKRSRTIFLTPAGRPFTQELAHELSREERLFLVSGRYKGIDERVLEEYADDRVSIGDYVLSGGELPALVVIDAVMRLLPGVLGDFASAEEDSFQTGLLDVPQYTRPREFRGRAVPEVLLSGHHENIRRWRRRQALRRTLLHRPELLERTQLDGEDRHTLDELRSELGGEE
ncbi:MAG TPA: tRNA (guanosine(37)-N1)-methyltransferase TrmD [bacterium]|nr:tRNA (guanosine(37)-N1)-methyltransferase TrmD [bacterium]